eukprot:2691695-Pyramimonas_sp.AAC.1
MLPTAGVRPAGRVPADGARVRWHERGVREPVGGALRTGGGRGEPSGAGGLILTNTDGGEQREKVGNWAQGEKRGRGAMGVESTLAVIGTGGPAAALAGQWFGAFIVPETPHDDWLVEGLASHLTGRAPHRQSYKVTKLHTTKPGHMRLLWRQSYKATRLQSPS